MFGSTSTAMPAPLSITSINTLSPSTFALRVMRPPSCVNLEALTSKLENTCARRTASPHIQMSWSGMFKTSCWPRSARRACTVSSALVNCTATSSGSFCSAILPLLIRAASSRSSSRCASWPTWRSMIVLIFRSSGVGSGMRPSRALAMPIGASGLRSSWASMERNSFWRRCAASAWSRRSSAPNVASSRFWLALRRMAFCFDQRIACSLHPSVAPAPES